MYHFMLVLATTALLSGTCWSTNVNKHMRMLTELEQNNIGQNVVVSKHSTTRKFVAITQHPNAVNQHVPGTILELTCEALGAPAPTVHWFKNDAPVYEYDIESNEIIDTNPTSLARVSSTLLLTRTAARDEYTCLVTAGLKTARATTVVYSTDGSTDLSERSKLFPLAPRVLVTYKMYLDTIGSSVVLPCRVKAHPRAHITWKDNKGASVTKDPRMKVLRSGELVISPLRWSDMGEFTCHATNVFGSQLAKTFLYPARAG